MLPRRWKSHQRFINGWIFSISYLTYALWRISCNIWVAWTPGAIPSEASQRCRTYSLPLKFPSSLTESTSSLITLFLNLRFSARIAIAKCLEASHHLVLPNDRPWASQVAISTVYTNSIHPSSDLQKYCRRECCEAHHGEGVVLSSRVGSRSKVPGVFLQRHSIVS